MNKGKSKERKRVSLSAPGPGELANGSKPRVLV
jgi:hypothetical protein